MIFAIRSRVQSFSLQTDRFSVLPVRVDLGDAITFIITAVVRSRRT